MQCSRSISSKPNFTRSSTRYKSNQASADWGKRWGKISGRKHRWIPLPTHPHLSGSRGRLKIRESSRVTVDSASSGQVSNSSVRRISRTARDEGAMVVAPMRAACHRSWKRALWQRISARRMNGRQSSSVPVCFLYLELLVPSGGITNFACVCLRSQRSNNTWQLERYDLDGGRGGSKSWLKSQKWGRTDDSLKWRVRKEHTYVDFSFSSQ